MTDETRAPMISLRGGFQTSDIKLDRLPSQNTSRLSRYPAEDAPLMAELEGAPIVTRMHRRGALLDQSPDQALNYDGNGCVAFSNLAFMRSSPVRNPTVKVELGQVPIEKPGAIVLYHHFQDIDEWAETHAGGEGGTSVDAAGKFLQSIGVYDGYWWITQGSEQLARVIQKQPAIMGTWWWSGMDEADRRPDGLALPTGWRRGGHAYEVDGVAVDVEHYGTHYRYLFRCQQTWGPWGWKQQGTFWIPDTAMDTLLADQGECMVPNEIAQAA